MIQKKVLITGCGGMLGKAVYELFSSKYKSVLATDIDLNEAWLSYLDVRDIKSIEKVIADYKPNIIIHLAALTDLEYCQTYPEDAWSTNAIGTENIALMAKNFDCTLVYICTAGIFDGQKEQCYDYDQPNPISVYGSSKYYGEKFIKEYLSKYFVFRAGWMMGGGPSKDKKFINKIYRQIKAGATVLHVVDDKFGSPTYTKNFAESIFNVLQTNYFGIYNQVGMGSGTRFDVALEFVRLLGLEKEIEVKKVSSEYFNKDYYVPRPPSEKLVNFKLAVRGINYMKHWRDCLEDYSKEYISDLLGKSSRNSIKSNESQILKIAKSSGSKTK